MTEGLVLKSLGEKFPKGIPIFHFIDHYVWEIAWRAALEAMLYKDGIIIVAVGFNRSIFWFNGDYDVY